MAFEDMEFCHPWRGYQARVLRDLESHLDDDHLHVVAAPGSGKTVLGLEVMRRLARPALILAPNLAIRNQWAERLTELFLPAGADTSFISTSLYSPAVVTVATYQGLHAAWTDRVEEEEPEEEAPEEEDTELPPVGAKGEEVLRQLREIGVQTLILDEAHHLRSEWWKVLVQTKEALDGMTTVALTATPPYDVESREWDRYEELCGPIDTIISVPELVGRGDLCPHQDYVYFSLPTEIEKEQLERFKTATRMLAQSLVKRGDFVQAVQNHAWVTNTALHTEEILADANFFSSLLFLLHEAEEDVPRACLEVLGGKRSEIPPLNESALETLLTGFLYKRVEEFPGTDALRDELIRECKRMGAIERRKVTLADPKAVKKLLASSLSKLESVVDIARMESKSLGENLRMVILSDFIRQAEMPTGVDDVQTVSKMGVVPLFETLRRAEISELKLGILTGSLIVIPAASQEMLANILEDEGFDAESTRYLPLAHAPEYVEVFLSGQSKQSRVKVLTELFTCGGVNGLVGTQALLGEGWDAPVLNTLVLASFVGSYMLSNQMRGRAIRAQRDAPDKVANVWHLVAVDNVLSPLRHLVTDEEWHPAQAISDPFDPIGYDLGPDMEMLKRRFRAFEGPSWGHPPQIENGVGRLGLPHGRWKMSTARKVNETMLDRAGHRGDIAMLWDSALVTGSPAPELWEQVETDRPPRPFVFENTLGILLAFLLFFWGFYLKAFVWAVGEFWRADPALFAEKWFLFWVLVYAATCFLCLSRWILPACRIVLFNGTLEGNLRQVGRTLLDTLHDMGSIRTRLDALRVEVNKDSGLAVVCCRLGGATHKEEQAFLQALDEFLSPVDNPRYLLIRRSRFLWWGREDYHAVPKSIGRKKEDALFFARKFDRYVGSAELFYTRNAEGRALLLKARTHAMSAQFVKRSERRRVWQ